MGCKKMLRQGKVSQQLIENIENIRVISYNKGTGKLLYSRWEVYLL